MAAPQITAVNLRKQFLPAGEEATALDGAKLTVVVVLSFAFRTAIVANRQC